MNMYLGQLLPPNFDRMTVEEKMKYIDGLPADKKGAALYEIFFKLPPEQRQKWLTFMQEADAYKSQAGRLFSLVITAFLYDAFLFVPNASATKGKRALVYGGSIALDVAATVNAYRVLNNQIAPEFVKVLAAFVGVFTSVDAVMRSIALFSNGRSSTTTILSPKTAVAAAISQK